MIRLRIVGILVVLAGVMVFFFGYYNVNKLSQPATMSEYLAQRQMSQMSKPEPLSTWVAISGAITAVGSAIVLISYLVRKN